MRVGLDFDNTIVSYDGLFHKVALEGGWIPPDLRVSKVCVRDHLRLIGKEGVWTEMQGLVYGARMAEAEAFPGVKEFLFWAQAEGISVSIVSHKTRYPFLGPKYDLHLAARDWIAAWLHDATRPLVKPENVFFELTKEDKVRRIGEVDCGLYVDDLPEILLAQEFPPSTTKVLFDPDGNHRDINLSCATNWGEVQLMVKEQWLLTR